MRLAALAAVLLACAILLVLVATRTRVSERDVAWLAGHPYPRAGESTVYERYLARHRRHRTFGGVVGALVGAVVGVRLYGNVTVGIGVGSPLGDVLFCGIAGVLLGALSAETFRLSEPRSTVITASLTARPALPDRRTVVWARALVGLALVIGVVVAATGHGTGALACALAGGAVVGVGELTLRAVRGRRRPALSERAHAVDLRLRSFAATTVSRLELAAAVLGLGWTLASVPLSGAAEPFAAVAVVGLLALTVVLLLRAAPRPRGADRRAPAFT